MGKEKANESIEIETGELQYPILLCNYGTGTSLRANVYLNIHLNVQIRAFGKLVPVVETGSHFSA